MARRKEDWMFALFNILLGMLAWFLDKLPGTAPNSSASGLNMLRLAWLFF